MRRKVTVVGAGELSDASAAHLGERDYADVVRGIDEISGSDVVVVTEGGDEAAALIRDSAPNAVVVVAGISPNAVCETTLFPRARIIGVDADPAAVVEVVEAIVLDRGLVFTCTARCEGERGIESEFARVPVRLGAHGIEQILEEG